MADSELGTAGLVAGKLRLPAIPADYVERPRLTSRLASLIDRRRVVVVSATPGAGKTMAAVAALRELNHPVAWMTVDHTDVAAGRLVLYIEAALARQFPRLAGVASEALTRGVPHAEAAAVLAEAVHDESVVLVLDELERLATEPEPWRVIEALVRYAPSGMRIVLLSRADVPTEMCALPPGAATAVLGERDLAFTPQEAAAALAKLGASEVDAIHAVESTGGWVTGVLFEAWQLEEHVAGIGGEGDGLNGYLSSYIVARLSPQDRDFLEATSLLDEVTVGRAAELGLPEPGTRLLSLRAAHLPVSWDTDGQVLRVHSRFREYLLQRLHRRGIEELSALQKGHGRLLAAEGKYEEATEELLRARAPAEALATAEKAIVGVIDRMDFDIAQRWIDALTDVSHEGPSAITTAQLMLAIARDEIWRGVQVADRLSALDARDELARRSDRAAMLMAWCYMHVIRLDDVRGILSTARPGPAVDAVRYALCVLQEPPAGVQPPSPEPTGDPIDALVFVAEYALGRLTRLANLRSTRWVHNVVEPWRIAGLRATGQTRQALASYQSLRDAGRVPIILETSIGPEVLIDAGRRDEALDAIVHGRAMAQSSGSVVLELVNGLAEAKLRLRLDRNPAAARAVLDRVEQVPGARMFGFVADQVDAWYGLSLLLDSDHTAALTRLVRAVNAMVAGGRLLELPTAAVYLAEACWRAGDEDGADRATDIALEAARGQGANHILLQALADFPSVASRRIDAEASADSPWHEIGRALIRRGTPIDAPIGSAVHLREFGRPKLIVDGQVHRPRIAKTYELLAFLAACPRMQATRDELLSALFDGRADKSTRSYLRQAISQLRLALPDAAGLITEHGKVRLHENVTLTTSSMRLEIALLEAGHLRGEDRMVATRSALEQVQNRGEYLEGAESDWVVARRAYLQEAVIDACEAAADLAAAAGRYTEAKGFTEEVLRHDRLRETTWRLMMRIAEALGDHDGVIAAYRRCQLSLAEIGATPAESTQRLLENLRR